MLYYADVKETTELILKRLDKEWDNMNSTQKMFIKSQTDNLLKWFNNIGKM